MALSGNHADISPMSEKIKPALTEQEWRDGRVQFVGLPELVFHDDGDGMEFVVRAPDGTISEKLKFSLAPDVDLPALIALANASLPDSDPRKITREWVRELRGVAEDYEYRGLDPNPYDTLRGIADALESYLPPE